MNEPLFDEAFLAQLRRELHEAREALFAARRAVERAEIAYQMAYADFVLAATGLRKGMEIVITQSVQRRILERGLDTNYGINYDYLMRQEYPLGAATTITYVNVDRNTGDIRAVTGNAVGGIPVPLLQKAREQWVNQFGGKQ